MKSESNMTTRNLVVSGGDVIAKDINGKGGIKAFAIPLFAFDLEFGFNRIQLQLVFVYRVLD